MTNRISHLGPAIDGNPLLPPYQSILLQVTFPSLRVTPETFFSQIQQASLSDIAYYHLLEAHLANTDGVQVEIPLPGLGRLELSLTHHGQALGIDVIGGDPAAQNWLLRHRAPIERRLQAKTGRAVSLARSRKGLA